MTQQNAALVEQSTAAAESLKDQANRLVQVVQVFRISAVTPSPVAARSMPTSAPHVTPKPAQVAAVSKSSSVALKRPALPAKPALQTAAPAPSSRPVAASGDEGDWESF
jgi:hypothetical protein